MYQNSTLKSYIESSSSVKGKSLIIGEWNLNIANNISAIGNYRYRPQDTGNTQGYTFTVNSLQTPQTSWALETSTTSSPYYYGATDANVIIDGGYDNSDVATTYTSQSLRNKLLFSLEDCFGKFRPRSGINKLMYFPRNYIGEISQNVVDRPRYYVADKNDKFKYWNSFRTEKDPANNSKTIERGISKNSATNGYYIDDVAPFVVYKNQVPANRVVIKIQTNVGTTQKNLNTYGGTSFDPFYGDSNKTVPLKWQIQYLDSSNTWQTLKSFNDTTPIFAADGYLELAYGITNLSSAITSAGISSSQFYYAGEYLDASILPVSSITGYTYLVKDAANVTAGTYYIWTGSSYYSFTPTYGWYVKSETETNLNDYFSDMVNPPSYGTTTITYRNFQYIGGLRIVVDTMNVKDSTFSLIELSPRLDVDLSDRTISFDIKKNASDLGTTGVPIGELLSSTGTLQIFDYDQAFNTYNVNSILNIKNSSNVIVSTFATQNLQVKLYDIIFDNSNNSYIVPLKTLYLDGFPETNGTKRQLSFPLKDLYFYFETLIAPEMLIQNQPVSFVIATLLDNIGFSNYVFKRNADEVDELTIPYFFIAPNTSVAQVLSDLAMSAQMSVFFDESNNLVFMSRDYLMPSKKTDGTYPRSVDITLYGSVDSQSSNVYENQTIPGKSIANIIDIASETADIYTDGKINYVTRYVQKDTTNIDTSVSKQLNKSVVYKPVKIWEVSPSEKVAATNPNASTSSAYTLSAMTLNSDLSSDLPYVDSLYKLQNNILDVGEAVSYISRYAGYLYANSEIIRYDAVEFAMTGTFVGGSTGTSVWISSNQEYQKYLAQLPYGGKMYPTGKLRIYSEPYYDTVNNRLQPGAVAKHGRAQFGTSIAYHYSNINSSWLDINNAKVCKMSSKYIFGSSASNITLKLNTTAGVLPSSDQTKYKPSRTNFIKNIYSSQYLSENEINSQRKSVQGSIKSSALTIDGSSATDGSSDYISYVYKANKNASHTHFGTRMRIIGQTVATADGSYQSVIGGSSYYNKINGAGGGIAVLINPNTNNGYYFEIDALSFANPTDKKINNNNVFFYKLTASQNSPQKDTDPAVPIVLYQTSANILVDDGTMVGQGRNITDPMPTVYDLAVEYEYVGTKSNTLRFHLYLNNKYLATVEDKYPLKQYNNSALFVRSSSRVMFEHFYSIAHNYSQGSLPTATPLQATTLNDISSNQLRVNSINTAMQTTYLNGLKPSTSPQYDIEYDEFGTIMRECAYFNIKYDKAYPALYAKMRPTTNNLQGYSVSGFTADPYGAEFLIFNITDNWISLDESTGNPLQIFGITFTQQSENVLSVDDYFSQKGDLSNPQFDNGTLVNVSNNKIYSTIKSSRMTYGKKEFVINAPYIQNINNAYKVMGWMISKIGKPKRSVGVQIFANPMIQLGDIVTIDYTNRDGVTVYSADPNSNYYTTFVVYAIEYSKSVSDNNMTLYLSEVV